MPTPALLDSLRARIAAIEGVGQRFSSLPFDVPSVDERIPGHGIAGGALHEVTGSPALADDAAATIFIAGILARMEGMVLWCLHWRDLFAPALSLAGLPSDRIIFVEAGSDTNVLIAMEEGLRHAGLAGVVGELGKVSLTASRRLQLAAETSGVPAFLFRRAARDDANTEGSAAMTRWRVLAHPSEPLGIPSLARARWSVTLERARGGTEHHWIVEACDATGRIALPADLVDRPDTAEDARHAA